MKRFDFAIAPKELAEAMMADLGNGPTTVNGDRSSTYFLVAKAEKEQNGEITAALIENKAGLEPDEQFYGVKLKPGEDALKLSQQLVDRYCLIRNGSKS